MNKSQLKWVIIATLSGACLVGCGSIPQVYDNNEFEQLVRIETSSRLMDCNDNDNVLLMSERLVYDTEVLVTYTTFTPRNTEASEMSKVLSKDAKELKAQYDNGTGNPTYCKLKQKQFLTKVRKTLDAIAQKRRK